MIAAGIFPSLIGCVLRCSLHCWLAQSGEGEGQLCFLWYNVKFFAVYFVFLITVSQTGMPWKQWGLCWDLETRGSYLSNIESNNDIRMLLDRPGSDVTDATNEETEQQLYYLPQLPAIAAIAAVIQHLEPHETGSLLLIEPRRSPAVRRWYNCSRNLVTDW